MYGSIWNCRQMYGSRCWGNKNQANFPFEQRSKKKKRKMDIQIDWLGIERKVMNLILFYFSFDCNMISTTLRISQKYSIPNGMKHEHRHTHTRAGWQAGRHNLQNDEIFRNNLIHKTFDNNNNNWASTLAKTHPFEIYLCLNIASIISSFINQCSSEPNRIELD